MLKLIKLSLAAGALSLTAMNSFAALKLCSDASVPTVNVSCGANAGAVKDTGYPIHSGACAAGGMMPWFAVKTFMGPSGNGVCIFKINGTQVGTATLTGVTPLSGTIANAQISAPYSITPSSFPVTGSDISIQIHKTS